MRGPRCSPVTRFGPGSRCRSGASPRSGGEGSVTQTEGVSCFEATGEFASRALSRKTIAAEALIASVRLAIEAAGGVGYTRDCDVERLYRDVHGSLFHPLPRAKQTALSGRVALGVALT
jgi:alkylation response protein AidB-like acyl-CoA dehydrogenase